MLGHRIAVLPNAGRSAQSAHALPASRSGLVVWLLKDGEHLPVQQGLRRMRTGMLADALVARNHAVLWWASTFSHQRKTLLYPRDTDVSVEPGFGLRLLHAGVYRRNISLQRYQHHGNLGRRFRSAAACALPRPDVIVASFPPIEFAYEAMRFGQAHGIPVIVDVRDLWPDTFVDRCPSSVRPFARAVLGRQFRRTRETLVGATSVVAISQGCLDWGLRYSGRAQHALDAVYYTGYPDDVQAPICALSPAIEDLRRQRAAGAVTLFTFVGTFGQSYELGLVCDVARRLAADGAVRVHFALVGDGEQWPDIQRLARTLPNVSLLGWMTEGQIREVLALSDVGLVPVRSVPDAMPNKAFELMAAGVPILSSVEGEMERLLASADAGRSYRSGDVDALTSLVTELAGDPVLRLRLARNARALYLARFRASSIYGDYAEHVERVAGFHTPLAKRSVQQII